MATTTKLSMALPVALALGVAGCEKKQDEAPAAEKKGTAADVDRKGEPPAPRPAAPAGPWKGFDPAAVAKKWEGGAWVVGGSSLGTKEAWEVKDGKVTIATTTGKETLDLVVEAPCRGKVVKREAGGSSSTGFTFAWDGDTLYQGLGQAGVKDGDSVIACVSDGVYVLAGGTCTKYRQDMFDARKWAPSPAECTLEGDTFTVKGHGPMKVVGNVLVDDQLAASKAEKLADLAAAEAKLATAR